MAKRLMNGQEIIGAFEQFAPKSLAVDGDPIGLQVGTLNKPISRVMVALDVLEEVVDEAIENGVDLIIAHHPIVYRPLKKITDDFPAGRIVQKCIKHDIAVYAAHTNLDVTEGGVNDWLAEALQLSDTKVLAPTMDLEYKKIVVFVPDEHAELVRMAMSKAGAGHIGQYSHCSFNTTGIGTFLPEQGASPFIGESGILQKVNETRIETIVPEHLTSKVLSAMRRAHPYEEVAYDVYPIENERIKMGIGRIGYLPEEMSLTEFSKHVKRVFDVKGLRVVGNLNSTIKKVAVVGGDGNKFIPQALRLGADVLVTGDVYYHNAHDAMMDGLNLVDPGHNIEKVMKKGVKHFLETYVQSKKKDTEIICSEIHTDPFQFM